MKGKNKNEQKLYSYDEEHVGYSDGAFREVDIYETYVVKRPKEADCDQYYTYFSWNETERCKTCPFREACHDLSHFHYDYEDPFDFEKEVLKLEDEIAKYCDENDLENCYNFSGGIEQNDEYIDPSEGMACCEKEYNIWSNFEGHRGGLCDVLDYDEYSHEVVMRRAEIYAEKFNYTCKERKQAYNLKADRYYDRKTKKFIFNKVSFKGAHLNKKQRKEFKKLMNYAKQHNILLETEYFNILKFAAIHGYDWKPLAKTFIYANTINFWFEDLHENNWGLIGNRVVLTDFCGYSN